MVADLNPLYVAARSVLLDALDVLGPQRDAVVVVGAQAIYMCTGDADIADPPYTTDADIALTPSDLADAPLLEELMRRGNFTRRAQPGAWHKEVSVEGEPRDIEVDLMVPEALAGGCGSRSVELGPHDRMATRRTRGLEGAVVDNDRMEIAALAPRDLRRFACKVAGPAALLVAKLFKVQERVAAGRQSRIADKDAGDLYRLMLAIPMSEFAPRLQRLLADPVSQETTMMALRYLDELFAAPVAVGVTMAGRALRGAVPQERVQAVCTTFVRQVRAALGR
jgi:hypothetical protein